MWNPNERELVVAMNLKLAITRSPNHRARHQHVLTRLYDQTNNIPPPRAVRYKVCSSSPTVLRSQRTNATDCHSSNVSGSVTDVTPFCVLKGPQ
jgi:hypothetical protein